MQIFSRFSKNHTSDDDLMLRLQKERLIEWIQIF